MRLTELQPRWLLNEPNGRRLLLFKSPGGHGDWLTCKNFVASTKEQMKIVYDLTPDLRIETIVLCKDEQAWTITGEINNLTVMPSIDASKSGNWHGFIRKGEIK